MNDAELVVTLEAGKKKRDELEVKLKRMGITESWKIEAIIDEIEKNSFKWEFDNQFPTLNLSEVEIVENSLVKKESLCIELEEIEKELERLNSRYKLVKQEISNINRNVCDIQGHRLSDQIELEEDIKCHGYTTGVYKYRRCFVCGKAIFKEDLTNNDVVVKIKHSEK